MKPTLKQTFAAVALAGAFAASTASAAVVRVAESDFLATAGLITNDEFAVGTVNPVYTPGDYGGGVGSPTVFTGGFFTGQSLSLSPAVDCPGAIATGCVVGSPTGPLSLDVGAPSVFITTDSSFPTSPTLSGSPRFNGPIALLFDIDQFGVGFDGGFFDAIGGTAITAFDRLGNLLGSVANEGTGIEFLGLVSGDADIAGVFLELVGAEPAGYNIDNIRFGLRGDVVDPTSPVPLPAGLPLLALGLAALGFARKRRS